jgi:hypothetical protein
MAGAGMATALLSASAGSSHSRPANAAAAQSASFAMRGSGRRRSIAERMDIGQKPSVRLILDQRGRPKQRTSSCNPTEIAFRLA